MRSSSGIRSRHRRRPLAALAVVAGLLAVQAGGTDPTHASPAAWHLLDGFEAVDWPDPFLWQVPGDPVQAWQPSECQAKSGSRALRAFANRAAGPAACEAAVPVGALSQAVMTLDLRAASAATRVDLFFDLWMNLAPGDRAGVFVHLRHPTPDGSVVRVPVFGATSQAGVWVFPMRRLDLMNLDDIADPGAPIDLRGGLWELEWSAYAAGGAPAGGGAFIDNVSLVWEPDPALPTPTVRPTRTATATASASPTETATATLTATFVPTRTPPGRIAYLPLLQDMAVVRPTMTPTATATVSGTVTATPASPTATSASEPSSTPSSTPDKPLPFALFLPSLGHAAPPAGTATAEASPSASVDPEPSASATRVPPDPATAAPSATATDVPSPPETPTPTMGERDHARRDGALVGQGPRG